MVHTAACTSNSVVPADFTQPLTCHQRQLKGSRNTSGSFDKCPPQLPNLGIGQYPSSSLGDCRTAHTFDWVVVYISARDCPPQHRSDVPECPPSRNWCIGDLGVDHAGDIAAMQFSERDATYDRQNVLAKSALDLGRRLQLLDMLQVGFCQCGHSASGLARLSF